ncbi:MAG: FHA domain-containing protein [Muribaculaceae bacterium]|nr:FHA domain-containing protein [Muribaculaceae bacterium]
MMRCFNCKNDIEDDSIYCDQCGVRLFICPNCRIPGKGEGKKCGRCGQSLVDASSLSYVDSAKLPVRLVCKAENVMLDLVDGALIGRVEGMYAPQLSRLEYISARHATLRRGGDCWVIEDVGSRNGTAVNGQWCYTPLPFRKGDVVRIANFYDFVAE